MLTKKIEILKFKKRSLNSLNNPNNMSEFPKQSLNSLDNPNNTDQFLKILNSPSKYSYECLKGEGLYSESECKGIIRHISYISQKMLKAEFCRGKTFVRSDGPQSEQLFVSRTHYGSDGYTEEHYIYHDIIKQEIQMSRNLIPSDRNEPNASGGENTVRYNKL